MDKDKIVAECSELLKEKNVFIAASIENINHKPHPFVIGPAHIGRYNIDTSKPCAGYVNDRGGWSNGYKTGYHKCGLSYEQHTSDTVICLQLTRHAFEDEATVELKKLVPTMEANKIDGVIFIETEEKYRITPREETPPVVEEVVKKRAPRKVAPKKAAVKKAVKKTPKK